MKVSKTEPTVEEIVTALRMCGRGVTILTTCRKCHLADGWNGTFTMPDGQPCYDRLDLIAADALERLNDFQSSQCAKLLEAVAELRAQLPVRCVECEYTSLSKDGVRWCRLSPGLDGDRKDTDFCSYGVRKELST